MSLLIELDRIRFHLTEPGQPFEFVDQTINGIPLKVYRHLPPNISHFMVEAASRGDRVFLVRGAQRWSYSEAFGLAAGLAARFRDDYGLGRGARIAIAMRNSVEWIIGFLAIHLAGATAVLVNSRGSVDEIAHALNDTECALVIADPKRAAAIAPGFSGPMILGDDGFRTADGEMVIAPAPVVASDAGPDDSAIIMFTSGTTGRPKGAVLDHRGVATFLFGMRHNGAVYLTHMAQRMGLEPAALARNMAQPGSLAIYPMFHVSGASAMLMGAVINGGKIVMMDRWDAGAALALIARERITMLQGPPSIYWDVLSHPDFPTADLSSITNVGIGGQATPPQLLDELLRRLPKAAPGGGYGQTETNGSVSAGTGAEYLANRKGSGRILPGTEIRIADEQGGALPVGEVGEIWVRSPLNMAGYWNQPEANAAVFRDGWLRTGDVGYVDADRFIVVVDRKKDVVIRGGENIYCAELERVFQEFPGVLEVAAFGAPDDHWGERVVLAVVPQPGVVIDGAEMLAFGRQHLGRV